MEYDQIQLSYIIGLSATVWAMMEAFVKPTARQFFTRISNRFVVSQELQYAVFRFAGVLAGIGAVALSDGVSFSQMWYIVPGDNLLWLDVIITGVVVGLGDRGIHWVVDFIQDNAELFSKLLEGRANAPRL